MSSQFSTYTSNSNRVRSLLGFHDTMRENLTCVIDLSDILRAAHVLVVSALDSYVHELVREAAMEIYDGKRPTVPGYSRFRISLGSLNGHKNISAARSGIEDEIREQHGYLAFQHPDKIADAVRCVSDLKLWEEVGKHIGLPAKSVKDRLTLIVDRRNKIAHEADIDPTYGTLWPIASSDVVSSVDFIDGVAQAIDNIVTN